VLTGEVYVEADGYPFPPQTSRATVRDGDRFVSIG
jgi:hypothetical protein